MRIIINCKQANQISQGSPFRRRDSVALCPSKMVWEIKNHHQEFYGTDMAPNLNLSVTDAVTDEASQK